MIPGTHYFSPKYNVIAGYKDPNGKSVCQKFHIDVLSVDRKQRKDNG